MIMILFMVLRGLINIDTNACIVDQLGRSACMIYPICISWCTAFILNILSYLEYHENDSSVILPHVILLIFKTLSTTLMVNYLDYWSIIPIICVIAINMI